MGMLISGASWWLVMPAKVMMTMRGCLEHLRFLCQQVGESVYTHEDEILELDFGDTAADLDDYEFSLDQSELQRLDDIADHVEILRLKSRFVAKEFAWMEDREDLFAPASSSVANRLLPALYVRLRETDRESDYVLYVMDIADAYLTVAQEVDTIVRLKIGSETFEFMLGRVLPGQRDGAQRWYKDVTTYLGDRLQTTACATHPSLLRMEHDGKFSGMQMHVDDFLGLSPRSFVRAHVEPVLREKYKLSLEILEPGTEVSFLKRRHILSSDGQLRLAPHPAHFSKLRDLLNLHARVAAISKVKSEVNVADLGTKSLSCFVMKRLMYLVGVVTIDGTPVGSHEYEQYMSSQVMRMAVCSIRHDGYKAVPPHVLHRAITLAIMQVTGALGQPSSEDCDLLRGGGYGFIDVAIFIITFLGSFFVFFIFAWWTL
ncbi:unnamed protein product, partial [Symbiodinium necroappetens]